MNPSVLKHPGDANIKKEKSVSCWLRITMGLLSAPFWICMVIACVDKSTWAWSIPVTIVSGVIVIALAVLYCMNGNTIEDRYKAFCVQCCQCKYDQTNYIPEYKDTDTDKDAYYGSL